MKVPHGLLKCLSEEEILRVRDGALRILSQVGIRVMSSELRRALGIYGAKVEEQGEVVKLSAEVIATALEQCPSEVILMGRAGELLRVGGEDYFHYGCVQAPFSFDYETGEPRKFRFSDLTRNIKIVDSLPGFAGIGLCEGDFADVKPELAPLKGPEAFFCLSTKPGTLGIANLPLSRMWLDMAEIAIGGKCLRDVPTMLMAVSTTSPLAIEPDSAESLIEVIRRGAPVLTLPCPMGGGTSPYTLAGTLSLHTAESLFLAVACQAVEQRHPVVYGGVPSTMDMRTGRVSYGNPELSMMFVGVAQMARHFGLPSYAPIALTDSVRPDMQAGYEKMRSLLLGRLGGLNITQCSGLGAAAMSVVTEQIVIEHEMILGIERSLRGISVNDRTLDLDCIRRVGIGGNFLTDANTIAFLRSGEHFENKVANRSTLDGQHESICEKAHEIACELEAKHQSRVPGTIVEELGKYVETCSQR